MVKAIFSTIKPSPWIDTIPFRLENTLLMHVQIWRLNVHCDVEHIWGKKSNQLITEYKFYEYYLVSKYIWKKQKQLYTKYPVIKANGKVVHVTKMIMPTMNLALISLS